MPESNSVPLMELHAKTEMFLREDESQHENGARMVVNGYKVSLTAETSIEGSEGERHVRCWVVLQC